MNLFELLSSLLTLFFGAVFGRFFYISFGWGEAFPGGMFGFALVPLLIVFTTRISGPRSRRSRAAEPVIMNSDMLFQVEIYSSRRKAEFLFSNATTISDYLHARVAVSEMGLNPDMIIHGHPE